MRSLTRRGAIVGAAAAASGLGPVWARRTFAATPEPQKITDALIAAAKKEGKLAFYTSVELPVAERVAKAFEARFPGVSVRVERSGAERNFQRIRKIRQPDLRLRCDPELGRGAFHRLEARGPACLLPTRRGSGALSGAAPGCRGHVRSWRIYLSVIAYNTKLVSSQEAPRSFADLLDPRWIGKLVKAHPGYSGTIMTATQQMVATLGWGFFEKLAKQKVMQLQSAADPPKKVAIGERAIQVDGADYTILQLQEKGEPVAIVHANEGSPLITGPAAIMRRRPSERCATFL